MVAEHFSLKELTHSDTAERLGIDNTPNEEQIANLTALAENVLEPLRSYFGKPVSINVAFRCPELNKAVGGVPTSQHCKGEAADIHIAGVANDKVYSYIRSSLPYDQVIAENLRHDNQFAGWVHVSYSSSGNRKEALSLVNGHYLAGLQYV